MTKQLSPFCYTLRQSLTQWLCVHEVRYNSWDCIQNSENTSNTKTSVYFRNCSGVFLVPVYSVFVDGPCNTAVQLCVLNWLLGGTGELMSLCDWLHRWDDVNHRVPAAWKTELPRALPVYQYNQQQHTVFTSTHSHLSPVDSLNVLRVTVMLCVQSDTHRRLWNRERHWAKLSIDRGFPAFWNWKKYLQ